VRRPRWRRRSAAPSRLGLGVAAGCAALVHAAPAVAPVSGAARCLLGLRASIPRPAAVALTFDDGPHPEGTPAVLERLAEADARATFFLVGEQVERHPALAREIADAGHAIGLHGHTHRSHLRMTPRALSEDVRRGADVLAEATGEALALNRPPYGLYSALSLAVVRRAGLEPLLWSRHGRDWSARASERSIAERLGRDLRAGEVLLLHDADHYAASGSWRATVAALPRLLDTLASAGLDPVTA
jgi:peptidoglycan-N-acetylglucosamine deacetylase